MGTPASGNRTARRGRKLVRRPILSREAAADLRLLTAADQTTDNETVVLERLLRNAASALQAQREDVTEYAQ